MLLAAGRPVSVEQIARTVRRERSVRPPRKSASRSGELQQSYADRGVELREVASGWRVQIRPQHADIVSRLWQERPSRYSRALLETLALIAYRQPITRGEIEDIRGVTVSTTIMRTLHERNWIRVVGHREVPGRPELLGTTREFLDYFGLKSLDDLPTLAELRDLEDIKEQLELPRVRPSAARRAELLGAEARQSSIESSRIPTRHRCSHAANDDAAAAATAVNDDESPAATVAVVDTTAADTAAEASVDSDDAILERTPA